MNPPRDTKIAKRMTSVFLSPMVDDRDPFVEMDRVVVNAVYVSETLMSRWRGKQANSDILSRGRDVFIYAHE